MITHFQWEDAYGFEAKLVSYGLGQAFQLFGPDGRRIVLKLEDNGYVNLFKAMKQALENESASVVIHKFKVTIATDGGNLMLSIDGNVIDVMGKKSEGQMSILVSRLGYRMALKKMEDLDGDGEKLWEAGDEAKLGLYLSHDRGLFFKRTTAEDDEKTFKLVGYPASFSDGFIPMKQYLVSNPWYTFSIATRRGAVVLGQYLSAENGPVIVKVTPKEFEALTGKLKDFFFS